MEYVKIYHTVNEVFSVVLKIGLLQNDDFILKQKAINALQALIVSEAKYVHWDQKEITTVIHILEEEMISEN